MAQPKKITFEMGARKAQKARDFLAFMLSRRTPDEWSKSKSAAREMLKLLDDAVVEELGPEAVRQMSLR